MVLDTERGIYPSPTRAVGSETRRRSKHREVRERKAGVDAMENRAWAVRWWTGLGGKSPVNTRSTPTPGMSQPDRIRVSQGGSLPNLINL